ncbi:uncharacterized protein ASPGLDRAFT_126804 [Aspergillus glaucus CBS 516.65]|uniref:Zn(2)-C6 fungal-type domain-containing protein n=1 Tax=Aspergillus glaucus CBS 516.65 TaxID=1160497 RepID=A0A1L9VIZ1_ASPGL|nr:hypothetical protein ASPGLDRAFT_126804 [Aspergillus glaucus CBS 516.65]OJJ83891.1 hypothetical protein ASPGLDRAFT_126804 [Aspergillus glaucus CBS 516.65]
MRRVKKSRNGCARCKSKRVKCGEEKPHCNRCTRLGVRCPGYVQSLRWVTNHGGIQFENATMTRTVDNAATPGAAQSPVTRAPDGFIEPVPMSPTALEEGDVNNPATIDTTTATQDLPDPSSLDVDETNVLCENLWGLNGGSLPELDDLSSPISVAASTSEESIQQTDSPFATNLATTDLSNLFSLAAPAFQDSSRKYEHFSPTAIVRSYPPPSLRPQRIPRPLNGNSSWTLIEYYFKEVAALFSSYDSQMNPFRTTVSRLWGSSLAMCRTMQSMAAATLVHDFPQFGPMGLKMRNEAVDILTKETAMDDKSLLALLMLGQTASWHDPKDLGISFFNLLRKHLNGKSSGADSFLSRHSKNYQFFEEALVYWEMLLSFVADNDSLSLSDTTSGMEDSLVLQRMPHPWTGIARDTQSAVQEVGRLVRRERKRIRAQRFTSQEDITQAQKAIDQAQQLEERLLRLAHPAEAEIISPGDDDTPVWHLLTMAEAYRCTGLIQLYRVFPDLLRCRLPSPNTSTTDQDPFLSDPILGNDCNLDGFEFPWLDINSPKKTPSETTTTTTTTKTKATDSYYNTWLTEFTLTTLSRLKAIPMESRTRCVQPFLFVASSSELRLPTVPMDESNTNTNTNNQDNSNEENVSHAVEVLRTRKFVLGRLTSYLHVLPPKPIHVCLQLVKEVWRRTDAGERDVYWMDVMMERGWETTMG